LGVDKPTFYDTKNLGSCPWDFAFPAQAKVATYLHDQNARLVARKITKTNNRHPSDYSYRSIRQNYYLKDKTKESLTETVKNYSKYLPTYFTLPHPSPRNNIWMAKNKWFENKVLPNLKKMVTEILNQK